MEISKKQLDFLINSDARICVAGGSVRSGKTFIFNVKWLDYIQNGPPGDLIMVGKTLRTLEQNVLTAKLGLFDMLGEGNYKYNRSTGELIVGDRKIYCKGASDERSESKIRGMTLAGAMCDEITLYPQNFVNQLLARCSVAGAQQFWNCNPDSPFHFIKQDFIDNPKLKDRLKYWHFTMDDNPALDPNYILDLKAMYSGVWYKRMIDGLWVQAEGLIYDMFNDNMIKTVLPDKFDKLYVGIDYGTQNPCAFILIGVLDGAAYVIKEYYYDGRSKNKQKTDEEYASDFVDFIKDIKLNGICVDPSAASFIAALKRKNIYLNKAKNDVLDGIRNVSSHMSQNKFYVDKSCKNTIKELYTYSWDSKATQRGEDKPIKESDHALDAIRYVINTYLAGSRLQTFNRSLLGI